MKTFSFSIPVSGSLILAYPKDTTNLLINYERVLSFPREVVEFDLATLIDPDNDHHLEIKTEDDKTWVIEFCRDEHGNIGIVYGRGDENEISF